MLEVWVAFEEVRSRLNADTYLDDLPPKFAR
jgi:hypothetical protein